MELVLTGLYVKASLKSEMKRLVPSNCPLQQGCDVLVADKNIQLTKKSGCAETRTEEG